MAEPMRALTIYPEHVEAFALGIRAIETRTWAAPAALVGQRIALHAGARDPDSAAARRDPCSRAVMEAIRHGEPIQRSAVRVTAVLTACLPIVDDPHARNVIDVRRDRGRLAVRVDDEHGKERIADATSELPFGMFKPGNWGWCLADLLTLPEPVPAKGRLGLWNWEDPHA